MTWKNAVSESPLSFAYSIVQNGKAIRLVNDAGRVFRIDQRGGYPTPMEMSEKQRESYDWLPLLTVLTHWKRFDEMIQMAKTEAPPAKVCELHADQRGLATLAKEWHERYRILKELLNDAGGRAVEDDEMPNILEQISIEALALRDLL